MTDVGRTRPHPSAVFTTNRSAETIAAGYQLAVSHREELLALQSTRAPWAWQQRAAHLRQRIRRAWAALREPLYPSYPG